MIEMREASGDVLGVRFHVTVQWQDGSPTVLRVDPLTGEVPDALVLAAQAEVQRQLESAATGRFVLHASAVSPPEGGVIAILGESGAGKSTLAAYMRSSRQWVRWADDLLPVAATQSPASIHPCFQPNLPPDEQPPIQGCGVLSGVILLEPRDGASTTRLQRLSKREAAQELIEHTMGARLFCRELLARHLDWVAVVAEGAAFWHMAFARRPASLSTMADLVADALL